MAKNKKLWKKGPGKLGVFAPLLGSWRAEADTPMGKVACTREFAVALGGNYVRLTAHWHFGAKVYEELALYGVEQSGLAFWSFTSDGKRSVGLLADGTDVHPEALAFEAEMPAGLARMVYWPGPEGSVYWAVESRTKKGWNRFTLHQYFRA